MLNNFNKLICKQRNYFAIYGFFLMIYFVAYNVDGHIYKEGLFAKLFVILLPLFTSSIIWNWKLYVFLNRGSDSEKDKDEYLKITFFLSWIVLLFDVGMTYGTFLSRY